MKNYIGMDGHSSTCRFFVADENGAQIDDRQIVTNGRLLVDYVRSIKGPKILTFEESEMSHWFYGILKPEVDELIVCNPVHNQQYKKAKTDKLDAMNLCKLVRGGFLTSVYHDGSEREQLRSLVSSYQDWVEEAVRLKNRYKSLFRKSGQKIRGKDLYSEEGFLKDLKRPDQKFIGSQMYHLLEKMEESRREYVKEIKRAGSKFKEIKYLKTIPGIGDIQAVKIVSQVVNPKRFANKYKYFSYCGLVRHPRESDGKSYGTTRIWGNRILKCVYKMAGLAVLRGENGLRSYYDVLRAKGVSHDNASNAVCRKIAAVSLSVWKHLKKYDDTMMTGSLAK